MRAKPGCLFIQGEEIDISKIKNIEAESSSLFVELTDGTTIRIDHESIKACAKACYRLLEEMNDIRSSLGIPLEIVDGQSNADCSEGKIVPKIWRN